MTNLWCRSKSMKFSKPATAFHITAPAIDLRCQLAVTSPYCPLLIKHFMLGDRTLEGTFRFSGPCYLGWKYSVTASSLRQYWSPQLRLQGFEECTPPFSHSKHLLLSIQSDERAHVRMRVVPGMDLDGVSDLDGVYLNSRPCNPQIDSSRGKSG